MLPGMGYINTLCLNNYIETSTSNIPWMNHDAIEILQYSSEFQQTKENNRKSFFFSFKKD